MRSPRTHLSGDSFIARASNQLPQVITAWILIRHVEIALRHHIDPIMRERHDQLVGDPDWLLTPHAQLKSLHPSISRARSRVAQDHGQLNNDAVLNALPFGFWSALLSRRYQALLWPDLCRAFAHAPARNSDLVSRRVHRLGVLRNQIAHHSPVDLARLPRTIDDGLTLISYMAPDAVDPVRLRLDLFRFDGGARLQGAKVGIAVTRPSLRVR